MLTQIQMLEKKKRKSLGAIAQRQDNQKQLPALTKDLQSFEKLFFLPGNEAKFKLEQQRRFESLIKKHNLTVSNIGWTASGVLVNSTVLKHTIQVSFQGDLTSLPAFIIDVENLQEWIEVNDFSVSLKSQRKLKLGQFTGKYRFNLYQFPDLKSMVEG
ncbi:hypothetical protein [Paraglaciecola sp.]|uniref:hypothetical protein n=1 Tax=Paraglaciecola sp. TaxID=1920173 RepID=UPI003F4AAC60